MSGAEGEAPILYGVDDPRPRTADDSIERRVAALLSSVAAATGRDGVSLAIAMGLVEAVRAKRASVYLRDDLDGTLALWGFRQDGPGKGEPRACVASSEASTLAESARQRNARVANTPRSTSLAAPMLARDVVVGVVTCEFAPALPAAQALLLAAVIESFGALIERATLLEQIAREREQHRLRRERMCIVAHELAQPLSALQTQASLIARRVLEEPARSIVRRMVPTVGHLASLVSELTDASMSELGSVALDVQSADLVEVARALVERLGLGSRHAVTVRASAELPPVEIDVRRIEQVLGNLLRNAEVHGEAGGPIELDIGRAEAELVVSVTNAGGRIPDEIRETIFQPFRRGGENHGRRGMGLGLYISRAFVEAHGGRVWVDDDDGRTTFRFALPLAAAERPTASD